MSRCQGSKPDGTPCERIVNASQEYCYSHDPRRQEERSRNAARAGRSKPSKELLALKSQLQSIADQVLDGTLDTKRAAVAAQTLNVLIRALEQERRWRELGELEQKIAQLEEIAAS